MKLLVAMTASYESSTVKFSELFRMTYFSKIVCKDRLWGYVLILYICGNGPENS